MMKILKKIDLKEKRVLNYTYFIMVIVALLMLFYILFEENIVITRSPERNVNEAIEVTNYHYEKVEDQNAPTGSRDNYTWNVSNIRPGDNCLVFYVVHSYVEIYLDGKLQYSLMPKKGNKLGKTVGSNWISFPLYKEDEGKNIQISVIPAYQSFHDQTLEFLIGDNQKIYRNQIAKDMPQLLSSTLMIIVGIIFSGLLVYNYRKNQVNRSLISISSLSLILGVWKITDTQITPLLFIGNPIFLSYLTLTALLVIVVPIVKSIDVSFQHPYKKLGRWICGISCIISSTCLLLQIFSIADLRESLPISHTMIVVAAGICILVVVNEWRNEKERKKNSYKYILVVLCLIGAGVDIGSYYRLGSSSSTKFTLFAFLAYIVVQGILVITEFYKQQKLLIKQEEELESSRIMIMLSQIQPHFMFNCLNSISYLCKADPDTAERAIVDFSDYLRGNLDSLNLKNTVPFKTELKHLKIYLSLEKMRFQDRLNLVYDIKENDFELPALTVQPLVENAVKHGIGKKREGGTIHISTKELEECYEIVITDDGVGFEPGKLQDDGKSHIGIENVRNRLWKMSHAKLEISSELGKGSKAVIKIPK